MTVCSILCPREVRSGAGPTVGIGDAVEMPIGLEIRFDCSFIMMPLDLLESEAYRTAPINTLRFVLWSNTAIMLALTMGNLFVRTINV
jgi:hypothetical protein